MLLPRPSPRRRPPESTPPEGRSAPCAGPPTRRPPAPATPRGPGAAAPSSSGREGRRGRTVPLSDAWAPRLPGDVRGEGEVGGALRTPPGPRRTRGRGSPGAAASGGARDHSHSGASRRQAPRTYNAMNGQKSRSPDGQIRFANP